MLLRIFAESHCAGYERLGLDPAALDGLIRMQFQARQAQYRVYPGAVEYLLCPDAHPDSHPGEAAFGSCWLSENSEQLRVLDIAVLAEHRRKGVARAVLGQVFARASAVGKSVGLSVWHANAPAIALYREFGFVPASTDAAEEPGDLGNGYLELQFSGGAAEHGGATEHGATTEHGPTTEQGPTTDEQADVR